MFGEQPHTHCLAGSSTQGSADDRGEAVSLPGPCTLHLGQDWQLWITLGLILPASVEMAYNTMVTIFFLGGGCSVMNKIPHFCNIRISQIFKFWNLFSFFCFGLTIPSLIHLLPLKRNQTTPPALQKFPQLNTQFHYSQGLPSTKH